MVAPGLRTRLTDSSRPAAAAQMPVCPRCGADMRIIAFTTETAPVRRILIHIGEPAEPPRIAPARGPPAWDDPPVDLVPDWDALAQPSPEYVFDQEVQWQPPSVVATRQRRAPPGTQAPANHPSRPLSPLRDGYLIPVPPRRLACGACHAPPSDGRVWPTTAACAVGFPILHVEPFVRRKAALQEEIETLQHALATLKVSRKETPHHITIDELPEEARFRQLSTQSKHLVDTIKMIAYRAETAMANSLREHLKRPDEARRLLRALYTTEADLLPDPDACTLTVRLHHGANAVTDQAIEKLCEELNATETVFPRTNLRLVLNFGST